MTMGAKEPFTLKICCQILEEVAFKVGIKCNKGCNTFNRNIIEIVPKLGKQYKGEVIS